MLGQAGEYQERGAGVPGSNVEGPGSSPDSIIGYNSGELAAGLNRMEAGLPHGGRAMVQLCTAELPSQEDLDTFYQNMLAIGCHVTMPTARIIGEAPTTEFILTKGSPAWAMIIPIIIPAMIIGLIVFGIFKLEAIGKVLIPVMLVTFGGVIIIAGILARPAERVAAGYLKAKAG